MYIERLSDFIVERASWDLSSLFNIWLNIIDILVKDEFDLLLIYLMCKHETMSEYKRWVANSNIRRLRKGLTLL